MTNISRRCRKTLSTVPKMYNKILFDKISLCYCSFAEFVLQYTRGIVIMTNVIVVASGKGGTGKSTVCICLSVALLRQGKRVLLIDCDCGMRGLDIMLDIEQDILFDASDAVCGNCSFAEAIYKSKNNDNLFLMAAPFDAEKPTPSRRAFAARSRCAKSSKRSICALSVWLSIALTKRCSAGWASTPTSTR